MTAIAFKTPAMQAACVYTEYTAVAARQSVNPFSHGSRPCIGISMYGSYIFLCGLARKSAPYRNVALDTNKLISVISAPNLTASWIPGARPFTRRA
jgi:hypothetical protein